MRLELRHLQMLCAMADCGSVGRAAGLLGYSQQALSGQLQRIEAHFGQPLFKRTADGVKPTGYGAAIVAQARDVVTRVGAIGGHPTPSETRQADRSRPLRLATTGSPLLAGMVTRARDRLGELPLNVTSVHQPAAAAELLERGAADVALGVDHPGRTLCLAPPSRSWASPPSRCSSPCPPGTGCATAWRCHSPNSPTTAGSSRRTTARVAGRAPPSVCGGRIHPGRRARVPRRPPAAPTHGGPGDGRDGGPRHRAGDSGCARQAAGGLPLWRRHLLAWRPDAVTGPVLEVLHASALAAYRELVAGAPHFQAWVKRTYQVRVAVEAE